MPHHLLRIEDNETEEQALTKWWDTNGLDHEQARANRKEAYLQQLKQAAITMNRFPTMSVWYCSDCKIAFAPGPHCPQCGKGGIHQP